MQTHYKGFLEQGSNQPMSGLGGIGLKIVVPKESTPGESRVALDPDRVKRLVDAGHEVAVETGAGAGAFFSDEAYVEAGARIVASDGLYNSVQAVLKVQRPTAQELANYPTGTTLIGLLNPQDDLEGVKRLGKGGLTAFALELVPRIARAQKMDALSSMASLAGYKAVLIAAHALGKYFPMLITAAGTIPPAKVLVLGAGVAGLQAIATARRLGAVVSAYDIRPAVKEQVESLGAGFLELKLDERTEDEGGYAKALSDEAQRRGQELVHDHIKGVDVVITTAQVPGRRAPQLITEAMVRDMRPGSVIVDLAAENGGNCALSEAGKVVEAHGVLIHAPLNVPGTLPVHASQLYARNLIALFEHLVQDGNLVLDFEDEITRDCCVTHQGEVISPRVQAALAPAR